MPETRYIEEYTYPEGMPAKDKILANATVKRIPYEVSDEQIEAEIKAEARERAIQKIALVEEEAIKEERKLN